MSPARAEQTGAASESPVSGPGYRFGFSTLGGGSRFGM